MTKMQKWSVMLFAALMILLSGVARAAVPAPGWQCFPHSGEAVYEIGACSGHAPVFAYLGDGGTSLAYFMISVKKGSDQDCFAGHSGGWSPVELGAQLTGGYGSSTLTGEGISFSATPGAPADQGCLDSIRAPFPMTRVDSYRVDEDFLILEVSSLVPLSRGRK